MKRQGGFTLIELVVVIVILGILAVTAAPRFLNLQDDARQATLEGLRGAVAGAMGITYGRAAINGIETQGYTAFVDADNPGTVIDDIAHNFGYPTAVDNDAGNLGGIVQSVDLSDDFVVLASAEGDATDQTNAWIDLGLAGFTDSCVRYTAATGTGNDQIATVAVIPGVAGSDCGAPAP
ncbi:type II secretion system protein [Vibrio genomosp. F10 str. 9ZC157]|uniref:MSHA biogenesis protein MshA n=1 Tax=Vibrio genomosp. F10 str. ZF-129 TaxID=1187848 RepID=A0A1E5BDS8_9VIBR|nr:type II secretion system protein [Vibrio genomosp. F10]OEE33536.1 MSHA biogenesis protein MshA [Vibrio genomosp. F10 str. ZF-129]OEE96223.1 MSHA biogenesis protein MshA [Vibrio genomosp. F10 str. 9ZC157]